MTYSSGSRKLSESTKFDSHLASTEFKSVGDSSLDSQLLLFNLTQTPSPLKD